MAFLISSFAKLIYLCLCSNGKRVEYFVLLGNVAKSNGRNYNGRWHANFKCAYSRSSYRIGGNKEMMNGSERVSK